MKVFNSHKFSPHLRQDTKLYTEGYKIKGFGHLIRMQQHQLPVQALYRRRSEVRARGPPRRRWINGIKDIIEHHGMTIISVTHRALEHQILLSRHLMEKREDDDT
jgi:hypothetical protein